MQLARSVIVVHAQASRLVAQDLAMNVAFVDWRYAGDEPAGQAMWARCGRKFSLDRAEFHAAEIRIGRWIVRCRPRAAGRPHRIHDLEEQRRGATAAEKSGIALAVKIPDPDGEHVVIENCDRPGVVEAL